MGHSEFIDDLRVDARQELIGLRMLAHREERRREPHLAFRDPHTPAPRIDLRLVFDVVEQRFAARSRARVLALVVQRGDVPRFLVHRSQVFARVLLDRLRQLLNRCGRSLDFRGLRGSEQSLHPTMIALETMRVRQSTSISLTWADEGPDLRSSLHVVELVENGVHPRAVEAEQKKRSTVIDLSLKMMPDPRVVAA